MSEWHKCFFKPSKLSVYLSLEDRGRRFYIRQCSCGNVNGMALADDINRYLKPTPKPNSEANKEWSK